MLKQPSTLNKSASPTNSNNNAKNQGVSPPLVLALASEDDELIIKQTLESILDKIVARQNKRHNEAAKKLASKDDSDLTTSTSSKMKRKRKTSLDDNENPPLSHRQKLSPSAHITKKIRYHIIKENTNTQETIEGQDHENKEKDKGLSLSSNSKTSSSCSSVVCCTICSKPFTNTCKHNIVVLHDKF